MTIAIILGFLFALLTAGGIVLFFLKKRDKQLRLIGGIAGIVGVLLFVFIPFSIHTVNAGEVAVVKHLGKATKVRSPGTYFDFWMTEQYQRYDATVQNLELSAETYSKDAQTMDIKMTVQFQIKPEVAIEIAERYGNLSVLSNRIQSVAIEKAKSTLSAYSAMTIIETRSTISPEVEQVIKEAVNDNYCVNIETVVLTNIDFSDAFEQTVENKMIAEQEKLKAEYEKETAIVNAEKELEVAKLRAEARIAEAEAQAQSQLLVARAEARAIQAKSVEIARALGFKIVETTLTDEDGTAYVNEEISFEGKTAEEIKVITDYLKYAEYLATWDGKLPNVVVSGDGASVILPLPDESNP